MSNWHLMHRYQAWKKVMAGLKLTLFSILWLYMSLSVLNAVEYVFIGTLYWYVEGIELSSPRITLVEYDTSSCLYRLMRRWFSAVSVKIGTTRVTWIALYLPSMKRWYALHAVQDYLSSLAIKPPQVCRRRRIKGWMTRQNFFGWSESVCVKTYLSRIKVHTEQVM